MALSEAEKDANLLEALEALDRLEDYHRNIINQKHYLIDRRRGQAVISPVTGLPVLDPRPAQRSEKEIVQIGKQRDRLLGIKTVKYRGDVA